MYKIKTRMVRICSAAFSLALVFSMSGCASNSTGNDGAETTTISVEADSSSADSSAADSTAADSSDNTANADNTSFYVSEDPVELDEYDTSTSEDGAVSINLSDTGSSSDSDAVTIDASTVTITAAGTYLITGTLSDGSVIVKADKDAVVHIILAGASISNSDGAAIYEDKAQKLVITLKEGTENTLTDGSTYSEYTAADTSDAADTASSDSTDEDSSSGPNAALSADDDLTINGTGTLNVNGNYKNGIHSKGNLIFISGSYNITAASNGIKAKNSVVIYDGSYIINASGDGIKATNDSKDEKGYVYIAKGTFEITSADDCIQAATSILILDGTYTLTSGGGSVNAAAHSDGGMGGGKMFGNWDENFADTTDTADNTGSSDTTDTADTDDGTVDSMKGIKAGNNLVISGGSITIDSADDAMHTSGTITVDGGTINISAGDDAIHADDTLTITDGTVNVTASYEGYEADVIEIDGGSSSIVSSDDGFNASDGTTSSDMMAASATANVYINGGYVFISADGDGLDSNGSITQTAGTVVVNGPTDDGNGAIDYAGTYSMTGGVLAASGSSGMAQAPSTDGENFVTMTFTDYQDAGTIVSILDSDGNSVITYKADKSFNCVVICSPDIVTGKTYTLYTGGSASGSETNGLYGNDCTYTSGTKVAEFTAAAGGNYFNESGSTDSFGEGTMGGGNMGGGNMGGGNMGGGNMGSGGNGGTMPDGGNMTAPDGSTFTAPDAKSGNGGKMGTGKRPGMNSDSGSSNSESSDSSSSDSNNGVNGGSAIDDSASGSSDTM